ncbi:hypothetical protein TUN199_01720 [Pyrenophora tritici-repentis]|uniref:Uncharacterized protein n=1 Tax=Pyrenophora tritici-repentis TaxID=45151 RepID=A0A316ZNN5_9PLEO|nr:hypothetical protein Alg130_01517 [Pyrenophora tritici-repentis]KAI0626306.1 hypothetical protein TUN199_01720 [Pyrenophora tritici-repentis]KAI1511682.1 hypothetical protein Ptr86124_009326 [Pyrenophora tritici-repentis]KAI1572754.1 hypothetical protein PtrEW4_004068 [Pyrenophora tritici-repentis]KAI1683632.1 hypothetical protein KJE20_06137 [Pyrenophora tritici-repentis]
MPSSTQSTLSSMPSTLPSISTHLAHSLPEGTTQSLHLPSEQSTHSFSRSSSTRSSTRSERVTATTRSQPTHAPRLGATTVSKSYTRPPPKAKQSLPSNTTQSFKTTTSTLSLQSRSQYTTQSLQAIQEEPSSVSPVDSVKAAWIEMRAERAARQAAVVPNTRFATRRYSPVVPSRDTTTETRPSVVSKSSVAPNTRLATSRNTPVVHSLDTTTVSIHAERAKKGEERQAAGPAFKSTNERVAARSMAVDSATRKAERIEREARIAKLRAELVASREARTASTKDSSRWTRSSRDQTVSARSQRTPPKVQKEETRPAAPAARRAPQPTSLKEEESTDPFVDRTNSTRPGKKIGGYHTANLEFKERLRAIASRPLPAPRATYILSDRSTERSGTFSSSRRPSETRTSGRPTTDTSSRAPAMPQAMSQAIRLPSILKPSYSVRFETGLKDRANLFDAEKRQGMYKDLMAGCLKITKNAGKPTAKTTYVNLARGSATFPPTRVPHGYVCPKIQPRKTVRFAESLESVQESERDRSNDNLLYYPYEEAGDKRPVSWMTGTMNAPELQRPPRLTMWKSFTLDDKDDTVITKFRSGPQRQRVCQVRGFYARQKEEIAEGGTNSALVTVKQLIEAFYGLKMTMRGSTVWSGVVMDENDPIECALPPHSFGTMTDRDYPGVWKFYSEAYRVDNDRPGYARHQCWLGGNCVKFSFGRKCVCSGAWVRKVGFLGDLKVVKGPRPKFASGSEVMVTESLPPAYGGNGMTVASNASSDDDSFITEAPGITSPHPRPYVTARGPPENTGEDDDRSMSSAKPYLRGRRIDTPVGEPRSPIRTPSPVGIMSAAESEWYRAIVARTMARARGEL